MLPEINILGKDLSTYSLMTLIGIFVSGFYAIKKGEKRNVLEVDTIIMLCIIAIGAFMGAHIIYGITNISYIPYIISKIHSIKTFFYAIGYIFGGWVFYGGFIGGAIAFLIACKIRREKPKKYLDVFACMVPLFHAFGRIGCFLGGCCYGIESHIGFTYTHSLIESANHVRRFPIQLVESLYLFIIFFALNYLLRKGKFKDKLCYLYLILYPVGRFIFEFFRGDTYRGFLWIFSTSQWISIILFIIGVCGLIKSCRNKKKVL